MLSFRYVALRQIAEIRAGLIRDAAPCHTLIMILKSARRARSAPSAFSLPDDSYALMLPRDISQSMLRVRDAAMLIRPIYHLLRIHFATRYLHAARC